MKIIADLHIHSKYSRACSKDLDLEHINQWCKIKGINLVACADWTHPLWLKELKSKLIQTKPGLYQLKSEKDSVYFILGTEVSCIYTQGGKCRRIHLCLLVPDFITVDKIIGEFNKRKVNLKADGRPIMGLSAKEVVKIVRQANKDSFVIPAHAWTPWFSVFGSFSGFDSLKDCFEEETKNIFAIETGLSSDPPMNWRLSSLDNITLVSNSDAHSPSNLGREANVFEIQNNKLSFGEIRRILKEKDKKRFLYTIEFFPEEGKYHTDGHAKCGVSLMPKESNKNKNICPVCKKPLTVGVLNRVEALADRPDGYKPETIPYKSIVPLAEIISDVVGFSKASKKVKNIYDNLIKTGGDEFKILLDLSKNDLLSIVDSEIAMNIVNARAGQLEVTPGYDGIYGTVKIKKNNIIKKPAQSKFI